MLGNSRGGFLAALKVLWVCLACSELKAGLEPQQQAEIPAGLTSQRIHPRPHPALRSSSEGFPVEKEKPCKSDF